MNLIIKNRIYNTPSAAAPVNDDDEPPPKKQGGKRNGSGRKASTEPLTPINLKAPESILAWLDTQPQKSKYIIGLIRADMEKNAWLWIFLLFYYYMFTNNNNERIISNHQEAKQA